MTIALDHVSRSVGGEDYVRDLSVAFEPGCSRKPIEKGH